MVKKEASPKFLLFFSKNSCYAHRAHELFENNLKVFTSSADGQEFVKFRLVHTSKSQLHASIGVELRYLKCHTLLARFDFTASFDL